MNNWFRKTVWDPQYDLGLKWFVSVLALMLVAIAFLLGFYEILQLFTS